MQYNNFININDILNTNLHISNGMFIKIFLLDKEIIRPIIKGFLFKQLIPFNKGIKKCAVYVILNTTDNVFYIGSTCDIYSRINQHRCELRGNYHQSKKLQESFNNSNLYDFVISVIFTENMEENYDLEQILLDNFIKLSTCTNTHSNSRSSLGIFPNEETKQKISNILKGRKVSLETRNKISLIHKGKIISKETKAKMSAVAKLRKYDPILLNRMSEGNIGRKHSKETLIKKSISANKFKKRILIDNIEYSSLSDAAKILNLYKSTICKRLNNIKLLNYSYI